MISSFQSQEPAIDPANRITFLLDWEITLKCNLDCSYCINGHDNTKSHPPLQECLDSIDFMFEYVDLYMSRRSKGLRFVILNVYGGEALYHPNILSILKAVREKHAKYKDKWALTVTNTTNLIVPQRKLKEVAPYIDKFMVSYHAENSNKQKEQFKENLLILKNNNSDVKCVIMMHSDVDKFRDAESMIAFCKDNKISYIPKQLDHSDDQPEFDYNIQQIQWFKNLYSEKSFKTIPLLEVSKNKTNLSDKGRACCGGRQLCADQNYKDRHYFIQNKFPDWFCSVNEFFLFIKQTTKEIFTNKDCKMDFKGNVAPIGYLDNGKELINWTKNNLENSTMPVIQCKKPVCHCGLCAPKAKDIDKYNEIMLKYQYEK